MVVLQGAPTGSPLRIAGTFALLALFFSLTAHLAARNVLGDVELKKAFAIGPVPPAISFVFVTFDLPAAMAVLLAVVADATLFKFLYDVSNRLTAYLTLIHAVVSIILGTIIVGLVVLVGSAPV